MKYLHSGYILFCQQADHTDDGRVDAHGLFDVFVAKTLPMRIDCCWVIGFGTPYERRQYKGVVSLENTVGETIFTKEFAANDPADIYKGHYIFRPEVTLDVEGCYTARVVLKNWKEEAMWDLERKFFCMIEGDAPPDP